MQWLAHQGAARGVQQRGRRQVGLHNHATGSQREVPRGGQVIQVKVACPRAVECQVRQAQLFVLQLQLDLVHLQFVQQVLHILGFGLGTSVAGVRRLVSEPCFSTTAQHMGICQRRDRLPRLLPGTAGIKRWHGTSHAVSLGMVPAKLCAPTHSSGSTTPRAKTSYGDRFAIAQTRGSGLRMVRACHMTRPFGPA